MLLARSDVSLFLTLAEAAVHGKTELPGPRGMTAGAWALPGERREKGQCGAGAVLQSYPDPPAQTSDMSARTRCRNGAACTSRGVFRICICGPRSPTAIPRPLSQTAFRQKKSQKDKNDETKRGYCGPWPPPPSAFYAAAGWRPAVGMTARLISAGCTPCCTAGCTSGCTSSCKLAVLRETVCGRFLAASLFFFVTREVTSTRTLSDEIKEKKSHGAARVARANNSKIFIFLDSPQLLPCGELGSFLLGGGRRFFRTKMFLKSSIKFTSLHTFDSLSLCISFFLCMFRFRGQVIPHRRFFARQTLGGQQADTTQPVTHRRNARMLLLAWR